MSEIATEYPEPSRNRNEKTTVRIGNTEVSIPRYLINMIKELPDTLLTLLRDNRQERR
jgi:hypothetical protein